MTIKIKRIGIQAFRGIPSREIPIDGRNLLIKGENGTGKSSIVDALEFFFTGKVAHLEGIQGLSLRQHGPHVNYNCTDVKIELEFNPGSLSFKRSFDSLSTIPSHFQEYFDTTQKGTFLLRRSQILEFIQSRPADRSRAIASILGIQKLDIIELNMKRISDDYFGKVKFDLNRNSDIYGDISEILKVKVETSNQIVIALNENLSKVKLPELASIQDIRNYFDIHYQKIRKHEVLKYTLLLNNINERIKKPFFNENLLQELFNLNLVLAELLDEETDKELKSMDILKKGKEFLEYYSSKTCPLCEQQIDQKNTLKRITERLEVIKSLSERATKIRKTSSFLSESIKKSIEEFKELVKNPVLQTLDSNLSKIITQRSHSLNQYLNKIKLLKELKIIFPFDQFKQEVEEIEQFRKILLEKIKKELYKIKLSEKESNEVEIIKILESIRVKYKDLLKNKQDLQNHQRILTKAQIIYQEFSKSKKRVIQEKYNSIRSNVEQFYTQIHPDDPHRNIELNVIETRRSSTDLRIESFGRESEDPRALTSEGHLDSLGLCIFLAIIKTFNTNCSLIVLDDIVTTVDRSHRAQIALLLLTEFQDSQIIITTHDGIWFEQLLATQRSLGIQGKFCNLQITGWNRESGPRISSLKPRDERIVDFLDNNNKESAGNETRSYFEWLLSVICENSRTPIEFKQSGRYTVGDLFDPAKIRLLKLTRSSPNYTTFAQVFQELERTRIVGNLVSHNNMNLGEMSLSEIRSFYEAVKALEVVFSCSTCGRVLKYSRDFEILRCSNSRCSNPLEIRRR